MMHQQIAHHALKSGLQEIFSEQIRSLKGGDYLISAIINHDNRDQVDRGAVFMNFLLCTAGKKSVACGGFFKHVCSMPAHF